MLVGSMIEHVVYDDLDAALVRFTHEAVEIRERAELRVDVFVVAHVVAEINLRRRIEGSDPDGIHAKLGEVVQLRRDSVKVSDTVAVGILKTARVNLVKDRVLPPGGAEGALAARHARRPTIRWPAPLLRYRGPGHAAKL